MKRILPLCLFVLSAPACWAADKAAARSPRSTPEAQGISSSAIMAFVREAEQKIDALHSIMIVRHGHVVAEGWWAPYGANTRHELYSLSKSFTSTAVGLAIAEGKLSLNDPVLKFFPMEGPANPSNNLKLMRVHDLLRMSTGHQTEPLLQPSVKAFLAFPVAHKPGTHFMYNTPATYMLSAIVQKVTGQTVLDYLRPRLFEPLGIEDPTWGTSSEGISFGGYGLNVRTEDIARFGQLYLQKGKWQGKQLVPAAWVDAATARQISNGSNPQSDWDQGYGYQFWRCRYGAFRGDGAFGQYCIVMPEQDAVIAITSGVKDMQAVLNLVWDKLLPAMSAGPLAADDRGDKELQVKLAGLKLPTQKGAVAPVQLPSDAAGKAYSFKANDQKLDALALELNGVDGEATLVGRFNGKPEQRIPCGHNEWKKSRLALGALPEQPAAVSGAWTADNVYTAKICFYETPFVVTVRLDFSDGKLGFEQTWNVAFGAAKKAHLIGEGKE
jgi:CubicO group peptidase (beta-lactamase class C family)